MTSRYLKLSLLFLLYLLIQFGLTSAARLGDYRASAEALAFRVQDPESNLSFGGRLPLACADQWSIQLLTGVSDSLGASLIERRDQIGRAAKSGSESEALELAHGVGKTLSARLGRFLNPRGECLVSYAER